MTAAAYMVRRKPAPALERPKESVAPEGTKTSAPEAAFYAGKPVLSLGVRTKLVVGSTSDPQEREADAVADRIVSGRSATVTHSAGGSCTTCCPACSTLHRKPHSDEEEVHRSAIDEAETSSAMHTAAAHAVRNSGAGEPMKPQTRAILEQSTGATLQDVRVHADATAHASAETLRARAFAHGSHIWLGRGESQDDLHLMAHETAHVLQDNQTTVRRRALSGTPAIPVVPPFSSPTTPGPAPPTEAKAPPAVAAPRVDVAPTVAPPKADRPASTAPPAAAAPADGPPPPPKAPVKLLMPEPPAGLSRGDRARIAHVNENAAKAADINIVLHPADETMKEARRAVTPPKEENQALASGELVKALGNKPIPPSPSIALYCWKLRLAIAAKRPDDEDTLKNQNSADVAKSAGQQLNDDIKDDSKTMQGTYADLKNTPQGALGKKEGDIVPQAATVPLPKANAAAAVPGQVPEKNVSLQADVDSTQAKIDAAGMSTEPAKLVQDGPIAEARAAQGDLAEAAEKDVAQVLAEQQAAADKAGGDMADLQRAALAALASSRSTTVKTIGTDQKGMVPSEEQMRTTASTQAQAYFTAAQTAVDSLLNPLPKNSMDKWNARVAQFATRFDRDLKEVHDWVHERHSGPIGSTIVSLWDWGTGLPGWVTDRYDEVEKQFGDSICNLLTEISTDVNGIMAACEVIIKTARTNIDNVFIALKNTTLKDWAEKQQAGFGEQLDSLQKRAYATRDDFDKDLLEKATTTVHAARERIADLRAAAQGFVGRVIDAIGEFLDDPITFIINGLLKLLGIPPASFWSVVDRISKVISDIADDPLGFASNLLDAVGKGFGKFFDHIGTHLMEGIIGWLLSGLGNVGVHIPKDLSIKSVITFFLELMGITWPRIRKLLVKHVGEKNVALVEKAWSIISQLIEKGPMGVWELIEDKLNPQVILDMIIQTAKDALMSALIKQVTARILLLFNPVGAILQALEAIYRVLKWVFHNAAKIFTLIETIVGGIENILRGDTDGMADAIENALTSLLVPVIDFLADYMSLGDLPEQIAGVVKKMQDWVEGIIDTVIEWLVTQGKALLAAAGVTEKGEPKDDAQIAPMTIEKPFSMKGTPHTLTAKIYTDRLEFIVQSEPLDLKKALGAAITTVHNQRDPRPPDYDELEKELRGIDRSLDYKEMREDYIAEEARDPHGSNRRVTEQAFFDARLTILTNRLFQLANEHNLQDLAHFFLAIPDQRFLPVGYPIRARLYIAGSGWDSVRKEITRTERTRIRGLVIKAKKDGDQTVIDDLIKSDQLPPGVRVDNINPEWITNGTFRYDVDHEKSLAEHWERTNGNNTKDGDRLEETVRRINLRYILRRPNRSKGSQVDGDPDDEAGFLRWVGPDFTSRRAQNNAPLATTIDGLPFTLSEGGPPIVGPLPK